MVVDKIYEQLKERDRRLSKSKFSREYLNKDRNYWFVCRYNNTDISNNALMNLYGNLRRYSKIWFEISSDSQTSNSKHYKDRCVFMSQLADCVLDEIEKRALD